MKFFHKHFEFLIIPNGSSLFVLFLYQCDNLYHPFIYLAVYFVRNSFQSDFLFRFSSVSCVARFPLHLVFQSRNVCIPKPLLCTGDEIALTKIIYRLFGETFLEHLHPIKKIISTAKIFSLNIIHSITFRFFNALVEHFLTPLNIWNLKSSYRKLHRNFCYSERNE